MRRRRTVFGTQLRRPVIQVASVCLAIAIAFLSSKEGQAHSGHGHGVSDPVTGAWSWSCHDCPAPNKGKKATEEIFLHFFDPLPPPPDVTKPTIPGSLTASAASASQINLTWMPSTDNLGVTGYRLESCQGPSCTQFTELVATAGTSYSHVGLTPSTTHRYRARAADAAGNFSSYSSVATATTLAAPPPPPPPPVIQSAVVTTMTSNFAGATVTIEGPGQVLEFSYNAQPTYTAIPTFVPSTATFVHVFTWPAGTSWACYRTKGMDGIFTEQACGPVVPSPPSGAILSWTQSTSSDVATNKIYVGVAAGASGPAITIPAATTYTVADLAPGTTYYFCVSAADAAGNESGCSNEVSKTILAR